MALVKWLSACVAGAVVAVGLFFGMSRLVALGNIGLSDDDRGGQIEFVRLKREPPEVRRKEKKPERQEVQSAPTTPSIPTSNDQARPAPAAANMEFGLPTGVPKLEMQGGLSAGTVQDREAVPVVRVNPVYPSSAASRGIEGYVTVRFTIAASGGVDDAAVIDSSPRGVFDREALKAIKRWRYDPKLVDGKPVARPNQKVTLRFELGE